jgi:hypothetical protein
LRIGRQAAASRHKTKVTSRHLRILQMSELV